MAARLWGSLDERRQAGRKTMHRLALLAAFVIGLSGITSADAARHKKVKGTPQPAPAYAQPANRPDIRPPWAMSPQQCFTDDGYGRFLPCAIGDGR
jgi:hypothetical protein